MGMGIAGSAVVRFRHTILGVQYMVAERYEYRGRSITIHLHELYRNGWIWSFSVDGVKGGEEADMAMSSPEIVLANAMRAARAHVDGAMQKTD
jgi:hypothetical protein